MADFTLMRTLHQPAETKMVLLVMDGVGGLSVTPGGPTELEAANTPNLDRLAAEAPSARRFPYVRASPPAPGRDTWRCSATTP